MDTAQGWRIGISGSTGLIGSELTRALESRGHSVVRLVRNGTQGPTAIDPWHDDGVDPVLESLHAVIHLAGRSILPPWTQSARREIRSSRVDLTRQLCERLSRLSRAPEVFLSGSAMGVYGDRGDEVLSEESPTGDLGFLVEVARSWEAATAPLFGACRRVILLRTGIVLTPTGGALQKQLLPFRLGLGSVLGAGTQWLPWISLRDMTSAIMHVLFSTQVRGAVNFVSPEPVTNAEFTATLARVLHRPALFRIPALPLRLVLGGAADELFLASQKGEPSVLLRTGFSFQDRKLEPALKAMLGS